MNIGDEVGVVNLTSKHYGMRGTIIYADIPTDSYHVAFSYTVGATIFRGHELVVTSHPQKSQINLNQMLKDMHKEIPEWIIPHGVTLQPKGCDHQYVKYTGMIEQFEYCIKCDAKKNKVS